MATDRSQSIAQVYAQSLFELAHEQGLIESIRKELEAIADAIQANPDFTVFLETPAIGIDQKKQVVSNIFAGKTSDLMTDFLMVVAEKGRLELLVQIQECYCKLDDQNAGRVTGKLTLAIEMKEKDIARLKEQIGRAIRKTVELETTVDPSILGGLILTIEDCMIDGSIRRSLQNIGQQLSVNASNVLDANRAVVE